MRSRRTFIFMIGAAALLAVAACGSNGYSGSSGSGGSSGSNAGSSGPTLKIISPAAGASVTTPFTLKIASNEKIGPTSTGEDHVHLYVDGSSSYQVVTSTTAKVSSLSPGKHTLMVSLAHADHSPAGATAKVTVDVTGGSGGTSSSSPSSGGGSYGY
jgi:hypothetical protein